MSTQASTEVARAVRRLARRVTDHYSAPHDYASVTAVAGGKLKAEVHGTGELLDDDEIVRGYAVRLYDAAQSLVVGDTLAVRRMRDGNWLAYEVISAATIAAPIPTSLIDAKGDLLVGTADNVVARKAVGSDGQVLTADAAAAGGVKWGASIDPAIVDAKGDLLVGTAADTIARKAVGSDGQLLTADAASAGGVKWATPTPALPTVAVPSCRVRSAADLSLPNGVWTNVLFDVELFDSNSMHSLVTNTGRITFNTAGLYFCRFAGRFQSNATGHRYIRILLNGSGEIAVIGGLANSGDATLLEVTTLYRMAANDFIDAAMYHDSGVALNSVGSTSSGVTSGPVFEAAWLGP